MRVVLDTNVLVAAFAAHGLCEALLEVCLDQHEIGASRELLDEFRKNLVKKAKLPNSIAEEVVLFLESKVKIVVPCEVNKSACRDPDDLKILGTARAFDAHYLVTGDEDLLILKEFGGIPIVSPRAFAQAVSGKRAPKKL